MGYKPRMMLVTGGAGFIGANFINHVFRNEPNIYIVNLDKLTYAACLENIDDQYHHRYHFIQGDITDQALIRHVLQHHHIDTIVNFAAESHVDRSISSPSSFVETNINGTFALLEAARHHWFDIENCQLDHCRFHQISTDEVYGSLHPSDPAFTENSCYQPRSPYAASKASADHLVFSYYHTFGLPITLSRCSNNYGPCQHVEKFIPTVILNCLRQKSIPIYGNGKNIRDWIYVEDHCRGIMDVIKNGKVGQDYNIGAQNEWENMTLAKYICERMDEINPEVKPHAKLLTFIQDRLGHDFRYAINPEKISSQLGWKPKENFAKGLEKTIHFYMEKSRLESQEKVR